MTSNFALKLKSLPAAPGVYQFLDDKQGVIYIGKAKNLHARVKQYFAGDDERPQIPFLMKEAADFTYTVVNTELESLYLERTLIQKHHPKYNIELKDDKSYAFIVLDYTTEIPQIVIRRRVSEGKSEILISKSETNPKSKNQILKPLPKTQHLKPNTYFGPYTSAKKIRDLILMARKTFGLCSATKIGKPCFYYHLHRCPGVCAGVISLDEYKQHLDKIKLFLSGHITPAIKNIKADMAKAAKTKKFEKAAFLRDQLRALEMLEQRQNVILAKPADWDMVGIASDEGMACVNLFKIRQGKMLDKENFIYSDPGPRLPAVRLSSPSKSGEAGKTEGATPTLASRGRNPDQNAGAENYGNGVLQNFLEDYYTQTSDAPKEIYFAPTEAPGLPVDVKNQNLIKTLIKDRFRKSVKIITPKRGKALSLVKLSSTNAREYLKNYLNEQAGHLDKTQRGLAQLKEILKLEKIPNRIECYDISNTQGTNPVGSMVVFEHGLPKKSEYRKFKIQSKNTPDDFAMMKEMLSRRLNRIMNQELGIKDQWLVPDLIVIDGGKGQLSAAMKVLLTAHRSLPTIGLAKRIEEIFLPNQKNPIVLPHDQPGLQLLQRLRDEAHRFGITFHRSLRSKQAIKSALDEIVGIGPKTKKLLKQKFGTIANIRKASAAELAAVVGEHLAKQIQQSI